VRIGLPSGIAKTKCLERFSGCSKKLNGSNGQGQRAAIDMPPRIQPNGAGRARAWRPGHR
jgi:hypothetical protein